MLFPFCQAFWEKSKKFGLISKDKIKHTKILIFILKIIPYMQIDERLNFFKKMEDFYSQSENDNAYFKMIKYYKKNWINNPYINYSEISDNEYLG